MALYVLFENKTLYCLLTLFAFYLTYECVCGTLARIGNACDRSQA